MTTMTTQPSPLVVTDAPDDLSTLPKPLRAAHVDALVASNRATTPASVVNERATKRLSISELNDADFDQLQKIMKVTHVDGRGPITRLLDTLDLPRNAIANVIGRVVTPTKVKSITNSGDDDSAFGLPRVHYSDILDGLGIHNRIINGVVGLVGDVAFDPLTYVGGSAIKGVLNTGGKLASFSKAGSAALKAAAIAHDAGRPADEVAAISKTAADYFKAANTPVGEAAKSVFGSVATNKKGPLAFLQKDPQAASRLADDIWSPIVAGSPDEARQLAAQALYREHGRAYGRGVRIFNDPTSGRLRITTDRGVAKGTGILHVPFTDLDVTVPAFTAPAKEAVAAATFSRDINDAYTTYRHPLTDQLNDIVDHIDQVAADLHPDNYETVRKAREFWEMHGLGDKPPTVPQYIAEAKSVLDGTPIPNYPNSSAKQGGLLQQLNDVVSQFEHDPLTRPADIAHAQNVQAAYLAKARQLTAEAQTATEAAAKDRAFWEMTQADMPKYVQREYAALIDAHDAANAERKSRRVDRDLWVQAAEQAHIDKSKYGPIPDRFNRAQAVRDFHTFTGTTPEEIAHVPLSEVKDTIQAQAVKNAAYTYRQNLAPELASVVDLTPDQIAMRAAHVSALQDAASAAHVIASATQAPVASAMTSNIKALADYAEIVTGMGNSNAGSTIIAGIGSAIKNMMGDKVNTVPGTATMRCLGDIERYAINTLGVPQSTVSEALRDALKSSRITSSPSFQNIGATLLPRLESIVGKARVGEADNLLSAMIAVGETPFSHIAADDAGAQLISDAVANGLLSDKNTARQLWDLASEMRAHNAALAADLGIQNKNASYFPKVITAEAGAKIDRVKANSVSLGSAAAEGVGTANPLSEIAANFQLPSQTVETRFVDAAGNERRFLDSDRIYRTILEDPARAKFLTDAERAYAFDRAATIAEFDKLTNKEQMGAKRYTLTPHEINRRVNDTGLFNIITQGPLDGKKFFETRASSALAWRTGAQERKYQIEQLGRMLEPYGILDKDLPLDPKAKASLGYGNSISGFRTAGGVVGRLTQRNGTTYLELGNQSYRKIARPVDGITAGLIDPKALSAWYPTHIADILEDKAGILKNVETYVPAFEELAKLWKVTTLTHPSWTINDVLGNVFYAINAGHTPNELAKHAKFTLQALVKHAQGDLDALDNLKTTVAGQTITGSDLLNGAGRQVMHAGGPHEAMMSTIAGDDLGPIEHSLTTPFKSLLRGRFSDAAQQAKDAALESWARGQVQARAASVQGNLSTLGNASKIMGAYKGIVDEGILKRIWQPWARLNGMANDWVRLSAYMSGLEKGMDPISAARNVNANMLDMGMATAADKTARQAFPFWNWMKSSGVFGVKQLLTNPKFFTVTPHLKGAIEETINGDQNLPQSARPSWIRDQLAIQFGANPDTRRAFTLTSSLPFESSAYIAAAALSPLMGARGLQDAAAYLVNSLNPVPKAALELGAHREFFTKRTIDSQSGDITPSEYLLGQIRPLHELGIGQIRGGPIQRAFSDGIIPGISRAVLGGRIQPFDDERRIFQLQREMDDTADAIRKRINVAEREGQTNESLIQRAKLLALYANGQTRGLKIPKWAEAQTQAAQNRS